MKTAHLQEYKAFGISATFFRKAKRLTQKQLAERMNVSPQTIHRIEHAKGRLSLDTLFSLSKALEVPLSVLFTHVNL